MQIEKLCLEDIFLMTGKLYFLKNLGISILILIRFIYSIFGDFHLDTADSSPFALG